MIRAFRFLSMPVLLALALAPVPARAVTWRAPVMTTLDNGMRIAVFPNPRLPLVQFQLLLPAGSALEPDHQSGVANLAAQALRQGTTSRDAPTFAADLDRLGGTLTSSVGRDYAILSGTFLDRDLESGLELLADMVIHPVFPAAEVDRLKRQIGATLSQNQQNPALLAEDQIWSLALREHPYENPPFGDPGSIADITRDQVRAFHRDRYRPDHAVLAIAGNVTPERASALARQWFEHWTGTSPPFSMLSPEPRVRGARVRIIDRPGLARAEIRIGRPGPGREAPEALALALANQIFGGGFDARLEKLAGRAGLADPRSALTALHGAGLFEIAASCPPESAAAAVRQLRGALDRFLASPPEEDELTHARRYLENVFPLAFESLGTLLSQWLAADYHGVPADFFERYGARLDSLSATAVLGAAQKWMDPDRLVIVAVGPATALKPRLEGFGTVEVIGAPAAMAAPGSESAPATAEQEKRGREILNQAAQAHGGLDRLRNVKDSTVDADMMLMNGGQQMSGSMQQVRKDPYRMVFVTRFQGFDARQTLNGMQAWSQPLGDSTHLVMADTLLVAGLRAGFSSDLPHLLLGALDPGAHPSYQGRDQVSGRDADVVRVDLQGGERRRFYFDAQTHQLLAMDEPGPAGMGTTARRIYGSPAKVDGVLWPMTEERQLDGQQVMTLKVKSVKLNTGVSDAMFRKPNVPVSPR